MKTLLITLLLFMAITGGLSYFANRVGEHLSSFMGCMRYTYDVTIYINKTRTIQGLNLTLSSPVESRFNRKVLMECIGEEWPEFVPFSVVAIVLREKESVMLETLWKKLRRGFTRTADDAVQEWQEKQDGMRV